jgi:hypothetical protein
MSIGPTVTIDEIIKLFKQYLGVTLTKTNIFYYIRVKKFPKHTGWGKPRQWLRDPVLAWFKEQNKTIKKQ